MSKQELTLYQVIAILNNIETKDKVFQRVGDKDFKILRGSYGNIMYKINSFDNKVIRPLPIFNYIQDKWVMCDE